MAWQVRELLGLPQHIRQEDGSRDLFEAVFQRLDLDGSKSIAYEEFATLFGTGEQQQPASGASETLLLTSQ